MRKARKWVLVLIALPVLGVATLWIDSYFRAVAAIRAEDERLAKEIADFRARKKPGLPIDPKLLQAKLPCPTDLFLKPERAQLEFGHSGNTAFRFHLLVHYLREEPSNRRYYAPAFTGDQVIAALSVIHQLAQECGYDSTFLCHEIEIRALRSLEETLRSNLPAAQLRRLGEQLDRCLAARPTATEAIVAQHLMDRAEVLRVLHQKADPSHFIAGSPGWRELFSWRVLLVKCLRELEENYRHPDWEDLNPRTGSTLVSGLKDARRSDRDALTYWIVARTAVAVAVFRAERERPPEQLSDLVPDVLPRAPVHLLTEEPVQLVNGTLRLRIDSEQVCTWDVRPK